MGYFNKFPVPTKNYEFCPIWPPFSNMENPFIFYLEHNILGNLILKHQNNHKPTMAHITNVRVLSAYAYMNIHLLLNNKLFDF